MSALIDTLESRRLYSVAPTISIDDVSVIEGDAGSQSATLTVSLSAASRKTVGVNFASANGTARSGVDYSAVSGKLSFAPGQMRKTITIPIKGDRLPEFDELLYVQLTNATNARLAYAVGSVAIGDNEPRISVRAADAYEGNEGTAAIVFNVDLSAPYDQPVTVRYATADSTTTAGDDYLATAGTITFAPGETTKEVFVTVFGDTAIESHESVFLVLTNPSANVMAPDASSPAYGSILDDDAPPYDPYGEGDSGSDPWSYWPGYYWY